MNMVFDSTDDYRLAIMVSQDAAEIIVQFVAKGFVAQKWPAVFGREHDVHEDFSEGLRHEASMREWWFRFNPFRVGDFVLVLPSVARSSQRWAV